jgi:putative restriction endonuclease
MTKLSFTGYVGNTDYQWFSFLRDQAAQSPSGVLDEVNFWKPSARTFKVIEPGAPFFFRLKAPHRRIGGFGIFARYVELPIWLAWDCFGAANGAATEPAFRALLEPYQQQKAEQGRPTGDQALVGCTLITQALFLPDLMHIKEPADWNPNIVSGKSFDLSHGEGLRLWSEAQAAAGRPPIYSRLPEIQPLVAAEPVTRYGAPQLVAPRLGQGTFRVEVMEAYERACAVTTEHSLPVLEAAHIRPYARGGPHAVANGVFLRRDLHALFDRGYITIDDDYRLNLGKRLRADYGNGRVYEEFHGQSLHVPKRQSDRPAPELLRWHQDHVFRG